MSRAATHKRNHMMKSLVLATALLLLNGAVHSAVAHSTMSKSTPAAGAIVAAGLSEITLGFTQPVRIMLIKVRNSATQVDVKADIKISGTPAASYTFPVEPLQPGDHAVTWTAVAEDGHVMTGKLASVVGK